MILFPDPLERGSSVRVIAPASPFDVPLLRRGMGWLAERYRVRFDRRIFEQNGYLAGSDERRSKELAAALVEPGVGAVLCARGGYGISRLAHRIDWSPLRRAPRWLVGFSDATALHVEAQRQGVASLHGPNVTGLGRGDAVTREAFADALERPRLSRTLEGLEAMEEGRAEGIVFGGNLTLLHACATAGRLRLPDACILLIEDVTERPYRIDRMLTTLEAGGHLKPVAGVVLGEFDRCHPGPDGITVEHVLRERLSLLGVPVAAGLPVGHGVRNLPLVLGSSARLDARAGLARLELG